MRLSQTGSDPIWKLHGPLPRCLWIPLPPPPAAPGCPDACRVELQGGPVSAFEVIWGLRTQRPHTVGPGGDRPRPFPRSSLCLGGSVQVPASPPQAEGAQRRDSNVGLDGQRWDQRLQSQRDVTKRGEGAVKEGEMSDNLQGNLPVQGIHRGPGGSPVLRQQPCPNPRGGRGWKAGWGLESLVPLQLWPG